MYIVFTVAQQDGPNKKMQFYALYKKQIICTEQDDILESDTNTRA